jgi:hypothetical protein
LADEEANRQTAEVEAKELVEEEAENLTEGLTEEFSGDFPKKLHPRD